MVTTLERQFVKADSPCDWTPYVTNSQSGQVLVSNGGWAVTHLGFSALKTGQIFMNSPLQFNLDAEDAIEDPILIQQEHYEWVPVYSRKLF